MVKPAFLALATRLSGAAAKRLLVAPTRFLVVVLAALLAASVLPASPVAAAPALAPEVKQWVTFNDYKSGTTASRKIMTEVKQLIAGAHPGASITFGAWSMNLTDVADTLIAAHHDGRDVRVLFNSGQRSTESDRVKAALGDKMVYCRPTVYSGGGCISNRDGGTLHAKFLLVSATTVPSGTYQDVVLVTSANPSSGQLYSYNDSVVTTGDRQLYAQWMNLADDMYYQRKENNYAGGEGHFVSPDSLTETWVGPRAASDGSTREESATDTMAQILKAVPGGPDCVIHVPQSKMDATRSASISQLGRLRSTGCTVTALTRTDGTTTTITELNNAIGSENWKTGSPHVHMKALVVLNAGVSDFVVYGSSNWTRDLRRNDEIIVRNENPQLVAAYDAWYRVLAKRAGLVLVA